ncbi:hypothetical protein ONZ45_g9135 [Pleurotus djamor]|nr:hypothetical protein ONZ45_g9135 [Pleurotus djamor]
MFMLFRTDFVKQKNVPGSIETNHGSLSKIMVLYLNYRFQPVHNKNKTKDKPSNVATSVNTSKNVKQGVPAGNTEEEERRCEAVAQLLLEGKKGEDLAEAVKATDCMKSRMQAQAQVRSQRRSHHAVNAQEISYLSHRRPYSVSLPLSGDWFPSPQSQSDGFRISMPAIPT